MTERDYVAMCEGFKLKEGKEWERTRMVLMFIYNSTGTKPISDPTRLFRIPSIDGPLITMNKDEIKAMFDRLTPKNGN